MTPRSHKEQPQHTTTFLRKTRNRADQGLAIQPQDLPQQRGLRANRAATLPTACRTSTSYRAEETQQPTWDPTVLHTLSRSSTSHQVGFLQDPRSDVFLSEPLGTSHLGFSRVPQAKALSNSVAPGTPDYAVRAIPQADLLASPLPSLSGSHTATEFDLRISAEPEHRQDPSVELQNMSTMGFMMAPAPYGVDHYGSPHHLDSPNGYPPMTSTYTDSKYTSSGPYTPAYAPSHGLQSHNTSRRSTELSAPLPPYQAPSMPRSPYQQSMAPARTSPSPLHYPTTTSEGVSMHSPAPSSYSYPAMHSSDHVQPLGSNSNSYPPPPSYPTSSYAMSDYTPLPTSLYPSTSSHASYSQYEHPSSLVPPTSTSVPGLSSNQGAQTSGVMPRILNSRPKPQCWEHGCNGRQFSTFSNLLRHQREKSGTAAKSTCPRCGAEFTRTTARNGHMAHEKCKPRRASDSHR